MQASDVCLRYASKEAVIAFYEAALAQGGSDAGAPTDQIGAQMLYFGTFIFDVDGNRIEAVNFPRKNSE